MVKAEPLTKEEFLSQMKELAQNDDIEIRCSLENKLLEMGLIRPGKEENHGSET